MIKMLKDWKIWQKYKNGSIIYVSKNVKKDTIEISKSNYPIKHQWTVLISTRNSLNLKHYFDTKREALKYAKKYMKNYND